MSKKKSSNKWQNTPKKKDDLSLFDDSLFEVGSAHFYKPSQSTLFDSDDFLGDLEGLASTLSQEDIQLNALLKKLDQIKAMLPEEDFEEFVTDLSDTLPPGDFEYFQLMAEPPSEERLAKLAKLVDKFPDNQSLLFTYLAEQEEIMELDYLDAIKRLEKLALRDWRAVSYALSEDPTGQGEESFFSIQFILNYYFLMGFYKKADSLCQLVVDHLPERAGLEFFALRCAAATVQFRLDELRKIPTFSDDERQVLLLNLTLAHLLDADIAAAKKAFDFLVKVNREVLPFFSDPMWLENFQNEPPGWEPEPDLSRDPLKMALAPLAGFLLSHYFACTQLTAFAETYPKQQSKTIPPTRLMPKEAKILAGALSSLWLVKEPHFKGIREDLARKIVDKGYRQIEDFKKITEEDLLKIPGIGKSTVKKLRDNGVVFKKKRAKK